MKTTFKIIITAIVMSLSVITFAQETEDSNNSQTEFKHSISMCPAAVAFGIYSVNYEYLHNQKL